MAIADRVQEAVDNVMKGNIEGALHDICSAVEVCAKTLYGGAERDGGKCYKQFVSDNFGLITHFALSRRILNLNVEYRHPKIKASTNGLCSVQEVFYHAVRCGLYHEACLPSSLHFIDEKKIMVKDGELYLPSALVYGLIVAVVISPAVKDESPPPRCALNLEFGLTIPAQFVWGKKEQFVALLDALERIYDEKVAKDLMTQSQL